MLVIFSFWRHVVEFFLLILQIRLNTVYKRFTEKVNNQSDGLRWEFEQYPGNNSAGPNTSVFQNVKRTRTERRRETMPTIINQQFLKLKRWSTIEMQRFLQSIVYEITNSIEATRSILLARSVAPNWSASERSLRITARRTVARSFGDVRARP